MVKRSAEIGLAMVTWLCSEVRLVSEIDVQVVLQIRTWDQGMWSRQEYKKNESTLFSSVHADLSFTVEA